MINITILVPFTYKKKLKKIGAVLKLKVHIFFINNILRYASEFVSTIIVLESKRCISKTDLRLLHSEK